MTRKTKVTGQGNIPETDPPMPPTNSPTLATLAKDINQKLAEIDASQLALVDQRISAGTMLADARKRCDKGMFETWCKANINRSKSDIYALMKLVKPGVDPIAAREAEKARAREGMAKTEANRREAASVSLQTATPKPNAGIWAAANEPKTSAAQTRDTALMNESMRVKSLKGDALDQDLRAKLSLFDCVQWQSLQKFNRDRVAVQLEQLVKRIRDVE
jgi:hypothetical protein